mgnify:CR=1 FL=1
MKPTRPLRTALVCSALMSLLLASSAIAITSAEVDSLRGKAETGNLFGDAYFAAQYSEQAIANMNGELAWLQG